MDTLFHLCLWNRECHILTRTLLFYQWWLSQEYSRINAYRMKAYHRQDLSATAYTPKPKKQYKYKSNWVFSICNVYSRLNPYFI